MTGTDTAKREKTSGESLATRSRLVSMATMLSRVLGLVREQLFAASLGATAAADAFTVAFRIPNLLRDLFAEGALSQAFLPVFKEELELSGREQAYVLGNLLIGSLLVIMGVLMLGGMLFAPSIVRALAAEYEGEQLRLAVELTRIMFPFLPAISLASVAMGMLNAQNRYREPALAPALFNVVSIVCALGFLWANWPLRATVIGWSVATLCGGVAQCLIQGPALRARGFRLRPRFDLLLRDPRLKRVAKLMIPALMGLAAVQINLLISTRFATSETGAVNYLKYAFRLLQLPIGVFGVAIATVTATQLAGAAVRRSTEDMAEHLNAGLCLVFFLTVPAGLGLVALAEPIVRLIFERGRFGPEDTIAVAAAVRYFTIGLVAFSAIKVIAPAFYAIDRARLPVKASVAAVVVNMVVIVGLHPLWGFRALALASSVAGIVNGLILAIAFQRTVASMHLRQLGARFGKVVVGSTLAAAGALVSYWGICCLVLGADRIELVTLRVQGAMSTWLQGLAVGVSIVVAVVIYGISCYVLKVPELQTYLAALRRSK